MFKYFMRKLKVQIFKQFCKCKEKEDDFDNNYYNNLNISDIFINIAYDKIIQKSGDPLHDKAFEAF